MTFELRIFQWSWGLLVNLDIDARRSPITPPNAREIAPDVVLDLSRYEGPLLGWAEAELAAGLRRAAPALRGALPGAEPITVSIDKLWVANVDWQEGATELAVVAWAAEFCAVEAEPAEVVFDKTANRYRITYLADFAD